MNETDHHILALWRPVFSLKKKIDSIYFWLFWVFIAACRPSLAAANQGCSLVAVLRLLLAVDSLVVEHTL